ncbi:MAG: hypothetical protein IJB83_00290 [Bacilli bacterium]|nr:hypothetical protein [Bacilli bacterium]
MQSNIEIDTNLLKTAIESINTKINEIEIISNELSTFKQTFYALEEYSDKLTKDYNDFENSITLVITKLKKVNNFITINVINNYNKLEESMRLSIEDLKNILNNL